MFDAYKASVLQDYKNKKVADQLSLKLKYPTAAKLKAECMQLCERYQKKDEKILIALVGEQVDAQAYRQAVKKYEADKFKPLLNFLKGETTKPDEKNVELLAWMTGFEPRPYQLGYNYESPKADFSFIGSDNPKPDSGDGIKTIQEPQVEVAKTRLRTRITIFVLLLTIVLIGGAAYLISGPVISSPPLTGKEKCMYWNGDSYQPVSCDVKLGDTQVFALDKIKVANFKRIENPDTLTENSLGSVWYLKWNNDVVFYTSPGFDPVHVDRRLKPITDYILNKYAHHN